MEQRCNAIRRRGLKALAGSSVAVLLVVGHPVTATADYQADDPSEGTPLDIVEVSSRLVGSPVKIRFTAVFMEPIDVSGRAWVAALMDARNKGRADAALYISARPSGALKCRLVDGILVVKRACESGWTPTRSAVRSDERSYGGMGARYGGASARGTSGTQPDAPPTGLPIKASRTSGKRPVTGGVSPNRGEQVMIGPRLRVQSGPRKLSQWSSTVRIRSPPPRGTAGQLATPVQPLAVGHAVPCICCLSYGVEESHVVTR